MAEEASYKDIEENQAVEEFHHFFSDFAKKISKIPEFKTHEDRLKKFGIRVVQISAFLHQDTRAKKIH